MELIHAGLMVSSKERAIEFFEGLLGVSRLREYTVPADLMYDLFRIEAGTQVILYDTGQAKLEVFIVESVDRKAPASDHLCIGVRDRGALVNKAATLGFKVVDREREGKPNLVFIYDRDGNPYEVVET